jgi:hypothetical protein
VLLRGGGAVFAEAEHQSLTDDPGAHVPVEHEAEAAKHLAFAESWIRLEFLANALSQFLVVRDTCRENTGSAAVGR